MPPSMSIAPGYRAPNFAFIEQPAWAVVAHTFVGEYGCCGRRKAKAIGTAKASQPPAVQLLLTEKEALEAFARRRRRLKHNMTLFVNSDPRRLICNFLKPGDSRGPSGYLQSKCLACRSRAQEPASQFFGIFRPTGREAINMMMTGRAKGKALNIKGKSAKKGPLAGFVPFLQISEAEHVPMVRSSTADARIRVFYRSKAARAAALIVLRSVLTEMLAACREAEALMNAHNLGVAELSGEESERACQTLTRWRMTSYDTLLPDAATSDGGDAGIVDDESAVTSAMFIESIDTFDGETCGLEVPERLLWEAFVVRGEISHEAGGYGPTGRDSEPAFMSLNLVALTEQHLTDTPSAVLWQHDLMNPLNPRGLLMAHEEDQVRPVASDIDAFLLGTKNVAYPSPLPPEHIAVLKWMLERIDEVFTQGPHTPRTAPAASSNLECVHCEWSRSCPSHGQPGGWRVGSRE